MGSRKPTRNALKTTASRSKKVALSTNNQFNRYEACEAAEHRLDPMGSFVPVRDIGGAPKQTQKSGEADIQRPSLDVLPTGGTPWRA